MAEFRNAKAFLSNFYEAPASYEGMTYPTSEHAFQAAKTLDIVERDRIRCLATPGESKRAGKSVKLRPEWESIKLNVMEDVVRSKFNINKDLAAKLIATGDEELVERNEWHDTYWGECNGKGENHLGKILMKIREELRNK